MKSLKLKMSLGALVLFSLLAVTFGAYADNNDSHSSFQGTLSAVNFKAMTVSLGNRTYTLSTGVVIKVSQPGTDKIEALKNLSKYVGRFVELKLSSQGYVFKITIKSNNGNDDHHDNDSGHNDGNDD